MNYKFPLLKSSNEKFTLKSFMARIYGNIRSYLKKEITV